jgi:cell division protein FtsZ
VTVIATGLSAGRRAQAPMSVVHTTAAHAHGQVFARTGTDNLPVLNHQVHGGSSAGLGMGAASGHHDFSGLNTPSVWRSGRTQAAAKVDALASNGMDEIEIPAFLRKQAD